MSSSPYVSGAVPLYLGSYVSGQPLVNGTTINAPSLISFLGWTVGGLDIQYENRFVPFNVDLGGDVEADQSHQGRTAIITATLSRWDDAIYQTFIACPVGVTLGIDDPGNIGTLMTTEGECMQLILPFPYQAKTAYAAQVAGTRFFACRINQDNWKQLGTKPRLLSLSWKALRVFIPGISNAFGYGRWQMFDTTISGLPAPT